MQNIPIGALSETNARFLSGWFMDPFIYNKNVLPVELLIQIGNVSEDILKDGIVSCESSLYMGTVTSAWGHASDTVANNYSLYYLKKDFGLDGLDDGQERIFFSSYLRSFHYQSYVSSYRLLCYFECNSIAFLHPFSCKDQHKL